MSYFGCLELSISVILFFANCIIFSLNENNLLYYRENFLKFDPILRWLLASDPFGANTCLTPFFTLTCPVFLFRIVCAVKLVNFVSPPIFWFSYSNSSSENQKVVSCNQLRKSGDMLCHFTARLSFIVGIVVFRSVTRI